MARCNFLGAPWLIRQSWRAVLGYGYALGLRKSFNLVAFGIFTSVSLYLLRFFLRLSSHVVRNKLDLTFVNQCEYDKMIIFYKYRTKIADS